MKGEVLKILLEVYTEVTDLKTWLKQIFGPESNISKTLIQNGDSQGYQDLFTNCLVARYHDVPPVQQIISTEQVSYQNELLLRIIERIKNRTGSHENVMAFGFRMLSTSKGAMKTQHYNVECFYPSYIYNRLCSSHFEKLLSRIGDEAMELLMGKRSLFMLLPPNSYLQLTGTPLYDLIKMGQEIYPKPPTKNLQKRKFPFRDEEILAAKKFQNNSGCQESIVDLSSKTVSKCFQSSMISSFTSILSSNANQTSPKVTSLFHTFSDRSSASSDTLNTPAPSSEILSKDMSTVSKTDLYKHPLGILTNLHKPSSKISLQENEKSAARESLSLLSERIPDFPPPVVSLSNQSKNRNQKMQNLADRTYSLCQRDQNGQPKSKKKESELSVDINKKNDPKTLKKKTRRGKRRPKNILASCSLMKMSFNPYNFYEVIPHTYILYAKDLHQRLDKYQLLCKTKNLAEVSEMIFDDMFEKLKLNIQPKVSLQCDTVCTTMTNQTSACEPVPGTSTSSTACPKCQVKSFLASQLKPLLQKLIKNHRSCHYISLLNYHCPIAVTKAKLQRRASPNQINTNHSKENINTSPKKAAGAKVIKRLVTKRRKASVQMLLEDYVLHKQVYRFLRACLLRLIPVELLGSKHNVTILLKNVKKFIFLGKFEKLCLGQIMNGMKVSACGWLRKIPSLSWRCHLLCQCLVWIFFNIIMVIIRGFFYVTETSHYRNRLFYYRKPVWLHLRQLAVQNFLSKGMLKPIKHEEVFQKMVKGVCLGVSCLRFLPKKKSFRPIINMNCANLKSLPKKLPIKQQVSGLFYIFNVIKEKYPDLMGHSVFCIDEIYKKWRTFVMKRQQTKDKRPLYFVKMDIQECFNFINQDLLKNIMRDILDMVGEDFIIRKYAKIFCIKGKLKRSFFYEATVESEHNPNFKNYIQHVKDKKKLGNSVIIDKVLYDHMKFDEIIKKLHCHVSNNVVKLDSHYYTQTQGISQGSVLSTLLCNIYYGHMENKMLKLDSDALMMRMVDDFLLVTPQKSTAFRFLNKMLNGIPLYNCSIQPEKTLINFAYDHKTYGKLPQILETEMLPWCGLLIDTKSLNIKRDYSRFSGLGISDILTVNLTPQMAANLCHKILKCINPKCLAIFVDKKINSITTIACNVFNLFYLAAYRFHVFILRLITKQQTLDSAQFFFRIIHYIADQFFKLVKTKMKQINSVQSYPLSKCENKWLCFMAFFIKVSQYQSQYVTLHSMLKKACSQGKAMLSTKRKSLLLKTVVDGQLESVLSSMK